ncbi:GCN5 family N-acetyltransferase [Nocardioides sp. LS1]|nr:GCN5 family N-acetyltransferase [Nocardioides sp. LS1]
MADMDPTARVTPGVRLRLARPSDLRHLAAVEDSGGPMFAEAFGDDIAPVLLSPAGSGFDRALLAGFIVVADVDGEVVGFAHVLDVEGHAHLEQISVVPEHGRRGIGSSLVAAVLEEARWQGYDEMSLCTYRDLPWNGPFYAGLGFVEVAEIEPWQWRLHEHEIALGLEHNGARIVMTRPVRGRLDR